MRGAGREPGAPRAGKSTQYGKQAAVLVDIERQLANRYPERLSSVDVEAVVDASVHPRSTRLVQPTLELGLLIREEMREHRRGRRRIA